MEILGYKLSDSGYFINLSKSVDRLENVNNQIKKYDIKNLIRVEALTSEWIQSSCTLSHRKVFEIAKSKNEKIISVFEDDFQINDNIRYHRNNLDLNNVLSNITSEINSVEWDVILLGCNPTSKIIPVSKNFGLVNNSTGAWAYLIKQRAYEYILNNFNYNKDILAIDNILPLLNQRGFKTLTTIPMLVHHGIGFVSTLQPNGPVNYTVWIEGSWDEHYYNLVDEI
jgi:GR25 family glycosyltransferase involved in LPS biosynthesis